MADWIKYKVGDYEKKFYDIKLHHGAIAYGCWPNAGMFNAGDYGYLDESLVAEVRESELNDLGMPITIGMTSGDCTCTPKYPHLRNGSGHYEGCPLWRPLGKNK